MAVNENKPSISSKIDDIQVTHHGNWLDTKLINYTDPKGKQRQWESVGYVKKTASDMPDCVQIVAILKRNIHHDCLVLVQQFRPPMSCYSIELPAGLIDEEDVDAKAAALRELYEETGYTGKVIDDDCSQVGTSLEPAVMTSTTSTVYVDIDGDDPKNINCKQHLDGGEFIKVILVPVKELLQRLNQLANDKMEKKVIDSRLYSFAVGLHLGKLFCTKEQ